jgi:phage tail sheath protein FI
MTYGRPGVYVTETLLPAPIASAGSANAAGAAIGVFSKGPTSLTLVKSWSEFVSNFGTFDAAYPATFGINQFFLNGGSELFVQRVLHSDAAKAAGALVSGGTLVGTVTAANAGADGNNLRFQITSTGRTHYYNINVYREVVAANLGTASTNGADDVLVESFTNVVFNDATSSDFAPTVVNSASNTVVLAVSVVGDPTAVTDTTVIPLTGGSNGTAPVAADFTALLPADGTAPFDVVDRPLVIFAPEVYQTMIVNAVSDPATAASTVHNALLAWATAGSGFAVVDTAPGLSVSAAITYITALTPASSQGAGYYPNYYIADPVARSRNALRKVGPASAAAGLYLATDKQVGPFKAPAGVATGVRGAVNLERSFTPADLDSLNTGVYVSGGTTHYGTAVNAIRNLPGAGIVVMGARTLLQDGTANKYVSTRRSLIYIKKQLELITQFAVFRNNDAKLWGQLRTVITVFLNEYKNQGGLRGVNPNDAFFVTIDGTNNTAASIENGIVNISVGVALEYPAEFVVINLSQIAGN